MELSTKRLILRDFFETDWEAVHAYASDPEVVRYMTFGPNTEEESRSFVQRQIQKQSDDPRRDFTLAITLRKDSSLIGSCGVSVASPRDREGRIGYCLSRRFWGKGYGTEAAGALLTFGFKELGLHRIYATCDPGNAASRHVLEKIGMTPEGHLRQNTLMRGRWRDTLLYSILEDEFD